MKCRRVQKLIPLYVEGDLQPPLLDRIASHLDWCGRCNWLVDEYKESQSWLHSHAAPEFDEAILNDLKRSVLLGVEEIRRRPSRFSALLEHWGRRQVFALSAAMLIVLGALVFYVYQVSMGVPPVVPSTAGQPNNETKEAEQNLAAGKEAPPVDRKRQRQHQENRSRIRFARRNPTVAMQRAEQPPAAQPNTAAEPTTIERRGDSPDMLRIEIRTSDPNIRIIWFAPKESDEPVKPVTETNE